MPNPTNLVSDFEDLRGVLSIIELHPHPRWVREERK